MYRWGKKSLSRMEGVDNQLTACSTRALSKSAYDMTIPKHGGKREAIEQNQLFLEKRSRADGYKDLSYHQSGYALDIIPVSGYDDLYIFYYWAQLMFTEWQLMISEGLVDGQLEWGGLFRPNGWDKAHWQKVKQ